MLARRADPLKHLEQQHPDAVLAMPTGVTETATREAAAALERFGRIDVLANVAGGQGAVGAAEEISSRQLREQLELNFFAAAELTRPCCRQCVPGKRSHPQRDQHRRADGTASFSAYDASKFALEGWSEALRSEVEPLGIHVKLVEPGGFRVERFSLPSCEGEFAEGVPSRERQERPPHFPEHHTSRPSKPRRHPAHRPLLPSPHAQGKAKGELEGEAETPAATHSM